MEENKNGHAGCHNPASADVKCHVSCDMTVRDSLRVADLFEKTQKFAQFADVRIGLLVRLRRCEWTRSCFN